ncbi:synapse differentiation-inducing protein 1-like, partial [Clarias magur]
MDPVYANEKSRNADQPPAYQADMGYPSAPAQGVYPPAQGYGSAPYPGQPYAGQPYGGAPAYPGQPTVTAQPTIFVTPVTPVSHVPDYLGYSIFTMLCCCLPLGIAALIYSIN